MVLLNFHVVHIFACQQFQYERNLRTFRIAVFVTHDYSINPFLKVFCMDVPAILRKYLVVWCAA